MCFLSSGSACFNLFKICTSLWPAFTLITDVNLVSVKTVIQNTHGLLVTRNLDRYLLANLSWITLKDARANDICKHAFAKDGKDLVAAAVKLLAEDNLVVSFGVGGGVEGSGNKGRCCGFLDR